MVESFLERIDKEIGARIDARLGAGRRRPGRELGGRRRMMVNGVIIGQLTAGVPLTVFALLGQQNFWSRGVVALILLAIVAINAAVAVTLRHPRSGR